MTQEPFGVGAFALASAVPPAVTGSSTEPPSLADAFSDYLKRELHARKWSVRYLAFRAGVDHSTVSRLLQGQRSPTLRTASRLQAAFLGGNPGMLLGIPMDPGSVKPVERVAAALKADPQLDDQRADHVLRYYVWMRSTARPTSRR